MMTHDRVNRGTSGSHAKHLQVARTEGLFGFYRGFGAVLSGVVPATALYFGGYESGKRLMPSGYGVAGDMLVGCYTQAIAGLVFTPVDIVKERMQVRYCPTCIALLVPSYVLPPCVMRILHSGRHCLTLCHEDPAFWTSLLDKLI